jgi:hypothetical protein
MAREGLPSLLAVAIERRYLDEATAARIADEARRSGKGPEVILVARGLLSERRVERLQLHVRYKSLRKADKAYAKVALHLGVVAQATIDAALDLQRRRFEDSRDCTRLGAILLEKGKLTEEQDRQVRARVAKISTSTSTSSNSAAATLMDDSASQGERPKREPSYELLDEAVARVEAVRKVQEDLSESVPQDGDRKVGRDSAADYEAACVMLARRRVTGAPAPAKAKSGVNKSTGGLRIGA